MQALIKIASPARQHLANLLLLLLLGAFPALYAMPATAQNSRPLNIAWSLYPGYSPFVIAFRRGLIENRGGRVKPVLYKVSARQMPDFESGLLDGGFFAFADALTLAARSPGRYRLVLVADNSNGADHVVAASGIESIADLRGKRIGTGIGSFRELLVRKMLQQNGLDINEVTLVNMGPDEVPDALPDSIQAGQTWEPFSSRSIARGARVIFSSAETPGLIPDVLVFPKKVIETRAVDVQAVVDAWFDALAYWRANPAAGNAMIARETGRDAASISTNGIKLLDRAENIRALTDHDDPGSLHRSGLVNMEFMLGTGVLNNRPDLNQFLDSRFLQN